MANNDRRSAQPSHDLAIIGRGGAARGKRRLRLYERSPDNLACRGHGIDAVDAGHLGADCELNCIWVEIHSIPLTTSGPERGTCESSTTSSVWRVQSPLITRDPARMQNICALGKRFPIKPSTTSLACSANINIRRADDAIFVQHSCQDGRRHPCTRRHSPPQSCRLVVGPRNRHRHELCSSA